MAASAAERQAVADRFADSDVDGSNQLRCDKFGKDISVHV